jgi:hypothetical protein
MEPQMTYRELIAIIEMFPYRLDCEVEFHVSAKNAPHFYKPCPMDMIYREKKADKFAPKGKGNYARVNGDSTFPELVIRMGQLRNEQRRTEEGTEDYKEISVALKMVEGWIEQKEKSMLESGMTEKELQAEIERIMKN